MLRASVFVAKRERARVRRRAGKRSTQVLADLGRTVREVWELCSTDDQRREILAGQIQTLQFCSFQATLDQFDVVFNDWCLESKFPVEGAGRDALLDPDRGLAQVLRVGFYFVPPHHDSGLVAAVFTAETPSRRPTKGRLVVHKRVRDQNDPNRRFERRGFVFQIRHQSTDGTVGEAIGAPFVTDSTGRAVFDGELTIGETYELHETHSPVPNVSLAVRTFPMDKPNVQLPIENVVGLRQGSCPRRGPLPRQLPPAHTSRR